MDKKEDKLHSDEWLKDLPIRSESEGYQPAEMIACQKCQRTNPPNRLDCIYCGVELEFDATQSQMLKPVLRKAETYARGYNLIYRSNLASWDESQLSEVAKMTRHSKNDLQKIFEAKRVLPIARAETTKETEIVSQRLSEMGIETSILNDEAFGLEKVPRRLRGLEFYQDKLVLILFNNDEVAEIKQADFALIVVGALFERKLETTEKNKKKGENKVLETTEISSDQVLIDIYAKDDLIGYRISQNGFDFSCLGNEKKMLAIENMKGLIAKLGEFAPRAKFVDDYLQIRPCLTQIWEVEESSDSRGMKRQSFGSYKRLNVVTTNNLTQFTKYSRLQWYLATHKL